MLPYTCMCNVGHDGKFHPDGNDTQAAHTYTPHTHCIHTHTDTHTLTLTHTHTHRLHSLQITIPMLYPPNAPPLPTLCCPAVILSSIYDNHVIKVLNCYMYKRMTILYEHFRILSITSNHPPADFAIDCKGATRCDVTPIEFLSSCMQLALHWTR